MKIAVLGTGMVGKAIATKLAQLGHQVIMGSRTSEHLGAQTWAQQAGESATTGTFSDAASAAELVFNCVNGAAALEALIAAGAPNLAGKVLLDVTNPLDFTQGMPPTLFITGADSLGERIQAAFPEALVVKTLNTVNAEVMVDPSRIPGDHDVFVSGNDAGAKQTVANLLREGFGWRNVIDLGDITTARGTESYLPLWLRLYGALQTPDFNLKIVRA